MGDDAFRKFGALTNVKIVMDSYLNRPKGYGFVKFEKQDDADAAKEAMDGAELMGRNLKVDRPTARGEGPKERDTVCYAFRDTGECQHGDKCRFDHGDIKGTLHDRDRRPRGGYDRRDDRGAGRYDEYDRRDRLADRRGGGGYDDDRRGGRGMGGRYDEYDRRDRSDDRRGGGGYDDYDRRGGRGGGYDSYDRGNDRRGGYDDRRGGYDDRRGGYDDRRGGYDDRRGGYDERRGGYDDR